MRICVWRTGHEIAETVADAVYNGLKKDVTVSIIRVPDQDFIFPDHWDPHPIKSYDAHIGYGILRGMDKIFRACDKAGKPWFNIDKGYLKPGHYDGYYRISLRGTQHTHGGNYADYERLGSLCLNFANWRGLDYKLPVLICPPTGYVTHWLPEAKTWLRTTINSLNQQRLSYTVRLKDDLPRMSLEHDILHCNYVHTFNSSVGWEAIRLGVPCVSDTKHSFVGSYFGHISLDKLSHSQDIARQELFASMSSLQLTLEEVKQGKLWPLMQRMLKAQSEEKTSVYY